MDMCLGDGFYLYPFFFFVFVPGFGSGMVTPPAPGVLQWMRASPGFPERILEAGDGCVLLVERSSLWPGGTVPLTKDTVGL